jgi:hypothetical protein
MSLAPSSPKRPGGNAPTDGDAAGQRPQGSSEQSDGNMRDGNYISLKDRLKHVESIESTNDPIEILKVRADDVALGEGESITENWITSARRVLVQSLHWDAAQSAVRDEKDLELLKKCANIEITATEEKDIRAQAEPAIQDRFRQAVYSMYAQTHPRSN